VATFGVLTVVVKAFGVLSFDPPPPILAIIAMMIIIAMTHAYHLL